MVNCPVDQMVPDWLQVISKGLPVNSRSGKVVEQTALAAMLPQEIKLPVMGTSRRTAETLYSV